MNTGLEAQEKNFVWEFFNHSTSGFFVEVGASDPVYMSQTWRLEQQGWSGILVEPLAECCEALRRERKRSVVVQAAAGAADSGSEAVIHIPAAGPGLAFIRLDLVRRSWERVETVPVRTLDHIFAELGHPKVDFLSIDVEGMELEVLRGMDLARNRPRLILVEDHLASLAVLRHLRRNQYRLVKRTGANNWFVPVGTDFRLTSFWERLKLVRKIWLKHPFRLAGRFLRCRRPVARAVVSLP